MDVLMCEPTYFDVLEKDKYGNTHMDPLNKPDVNIALTQWAQLVSLYQALGINVHLIDPILGLPDMTFTANCGFTFTANNLQHYILLSNFKPDRRHAEKEYFELYFRHVLGYSTVNLDDALYFEGAGDAIPFSDVIFVGYGFRTEEETLKHIEQITRKRVIPLKLKKPTHGNATPYHLDTAMMVFNRGDCVVIAYPDAFTQSSYALLKEETRLCGGFLIEATYEEFANLSLNALVIPRNDIFLQLDSEKNLDIVSRKIQDVREEMDRSPFLKGVVITSDTANKSLKDTVRLIGYHTITLPMSEFHKSGGGVFCLTKILE